MINQRSYNISFCLYEYIIYTRFLMKFLVVDEDEEDNRDENEIGYSDKEIEMINGLIYK